VKTRFALENPVFDGTCGSDVDELACLMRNLEAYPCSFVEENRFSEECRAEAARQSKRRKECWQGV